MIMIMNLYSARAIEEYSKVYAGKSETMLFVTLRSTVGHGFHLGQFSKHFISGSPSLRNRTNRLYPNYFYIE